MPIKIASKSFYGPILGVGGGSTNYLAGAVLDRMQVVMDIEVFWATENTSLRFRASDKYILRGSAITGSWSGSTPTFDNGSFIRDGWHEGDTFDLTGTASNNGAYTIVEVYDTYMVVAESLVDEDEASASMYGTNDITALDFYFNLVENGSPDNYVSLTDNGTQQRYNATGLNPSDTVTVVTFQVASNSKGWDIGSATIVGNGITDYKQKFRITHNFVITPVYRVGQLNNLINGIPPAPEYFGDRKSLKYIAKFDAKYDNLEPDAPHSSDRFRTNVGVVNQSGSAGFKSGNTGWLDEFVNGNDPEYSVESIAYTVGGDDADEVSLNANTSVEIVIRSASSKFSPVIPQRVAINQMWLPINEENYVDVADNMMTCFRWDYALASTSGGAVNGIGFGTDNQVITAATVTYVNTSTIRVNYTVAMSAAMLTFLRARGTNDRHYLISVMTESPSITLAKDTDRVNCKADVNSYAYDPSDATLMTFPDGTKFYRWPDEVTNPKTSGLYYSGERGFTRTQFKVKEYGQLMSLRAEIQAVHPTRGSFLILGRTWDTEGAVFSRGVSQVDLSDVHGYPGDINEPCNRARCYRMTALDGSGYAGYELQFGFRVGYEWWKTLDDAHSDFPKPTQDWNQYSEVDGWQLKYRIYGTVENSDGVQTDFVHESVMRVLGASWVVNSDPSIYTVEITTMTEDAGTDLNGLILKEATTRVRATISGDFTGEPSGNFATGFLVLSRPNGGGVYEDLIIASQGPVLPLESPWSGITEENYCTMELTAANNYRMEAYLDHEKLGNGPYQLMAYFRFCEPQRLLLQESGWPLLQEDGGGIQLEGNY